MQYKEFKNNPLTAHPLADQSEWYADDAAIQTLDAMRGHKLSNPQFAPLAAPNRVQEAGLDVPRREGSLSMRAYKE